MGGESLESEISVQTGQGFEKALTEIGYTFKSFFWDKEGIESFLNYKADGALLALHGTLGEDGIVQGFLETLKIPYSGCSWKTSAICFDKEATKIFFKDMKVPAANGKCFKDTDQFNLNELEGLFSDLNQYVVVKPASQGSSRGVSLCKSVEELKKGLDLVFTMDHKALVEEYIPGVEIAVSYWRGEALEPIMIKPKSGFYDYKNKYTSEASEYLLPAPLPEKTRKDLMRWTEVICKGLEVTTYSRMDFRWDEKTNSYKALEINTLPGCTELSLFPMAVQHKGLSFVELVKCLVDEMKLHA